MSRNPFSRNSNELYNTPYTAGGYEKTQLRKLLIVAICILVVCAGAIALIFHPSQQDKDTQSATAAARKDTPRAKVNNVKVAGGFAFAIVKDPASDGQANAGNVTVFKVNKDGSMTQLAKGSSFSPLDLLGLGIPLKTQAELSGSKLSEVKQSLANICNYSGGITPGFSGFGASFNPGEWQIDATTLSGLQQVLASTISNKNSTLADTNSSGDGAAQPGNSVICVNATRENSNVTTDTKTYISTFTLQVQFITSDGAITNHTLTFAIGPKHYRHYTLDGQAL